MANEEKEFTQDENEAEEEYHEVEPGSGGEWDELEFYLYTL
ncbi:MAG: hypothetical protein WDO71_06895 [Bacteroidota bacterium]